MCVRGVHMCVEMRHIVFLINVVYSGEMSSISVLGDQLVFSTNKHQIGFATVSANNEVVNTNLKTLEGDVHGVIFGASGVFVGFSSGRIFYYDNDASLPATDPLLLCELVLVDDLAACADTGGRISLGVFPSEIASENWSSSVLVIVCKTSGWTCDPATGDIGRFSLPFQINSVSVWASRVYVLCSVGGVSRLGSFPLESIVDDVIKEEITIDTSFVAPYRSISVVSNNSTHFSMYVLLTANKTISHVFVESTNGSPIDKKSNTLSIFLLVLFFCAAIAVPILMKFYKRRRSPKYVEVEDVQPRSFGKRNLPPSPIPEE